MSTFKFTRRALVAAAAATLSLGAPVFAGGHQVVDSIHFLIPAAPAVVGTEPHAELARR